MKKGISLKFDVLLLDIFFEPYSRMTHMIESTLKLIIEKAQTGRF